MSTYTIEGSYEGYLWKSNADTPIVYPDAAPLSIELKDDSNPFIVEAQLYDRANNKSKSVKYIDGHYIIIDTDLSAIGSECKVEELEFLPSFNGANKLLFKRIWAPVEDDLCPGYFVLEPEREAFVGFKQG